MQAMYDGFFAAFSLTRQLHSDLGENFESKLFYELCLLAGVNKSHTTAFHLESDGQTERMIRTLLQMLKTTADDNPATWPQRLPTVMAAYRMTVHKTTGMIPNMAMLGREVMLPAAVIARPPEEPHRTTQPFVRDLRDTLRDAHQRSKQAVFTEGQLVWLFWPRPPVRQKFCKLQRLWTARGVSSCLSHHWWWCLNTL